MIYYSLGLVHGLDKAMGINETRIAIMSFIYGCIGLRWGVLVFEVKNYPGRVNSDAFNGFSRGRITIDQNVKLPSGTYYYVLTFPEEDNPGKTEYVGYLFLYHD